MTIVMTMMSFCEPLTLRKEICLGYLYLLVLLTGLPGGTDTAAMGVGDSSGERPICLYYMSDKVKSPDNLSGGDQLLGDGTVLCDAPTDYCFSFWQIDPNNGSQIEGGEDVSKTPGFNWLARGCFKNAHSCYRESCVATQRELESSFFCCCKGSHCNERISFEEATHAPSAASPDLTVEESPLDDFSKTLLFVISPCLMFVMLACATVACYRSRRRKKSLSNSSLGLHRSPTSPCIDLTSLKFLDMLGQGRYGTVYRALLSDEDVAVKLFSPHHKLSFENEKYIYSLPLMEHENLLSYLGGGEVVGPEGSTCLGLVLSYCPGGRLSSFLQENTLDFASFCRVVVSIARGLGHLHSDHKKGDLLKPCVAHRDFNTRNILLKADMSCVVSDLGFAIHTQGAKFYQYGEEQIAEMASLTDVGTLRYMAPEVLEGAVNLRDCEASLKQIDIYALGLVLWEIAYRCHDLYQGAPTPTYALPFEAEIGLRPTFEQMQVLVARNKARPLIPQLWKQSNPAIKQLRETIEDCWDNDAEARLSAMCIERRLWELPKLWSRYKASLGINNLSPTANPPPPPGSFVNVSDVKSFLITNELSLPRDKEISPNQRDSSVSENTIETTVPFSPSDSNGRVLGKNELMEVVNAPLPPPLQPHQGRNPCLERNTINENSKELQSSSGSGCLIEASEKYPYPNIDRGLNSAHLFEVLENEHGIDPQLMNEHLVPLLNSFLPNSAPSPQTVQIRTANTAAPQQTQSQITFPLPQVPSIPYVQNDMRTGDGRPKRQNAAVEAERRAGNSSKGFWKTALSSRFALLMPRRKPRHKEEEERGILVTPISEPPTPLSPLISDQNEFQRDVHFPNGEIRMFLNEPTILNEEPLLNRNEAEILQPINGEARPRMAETEIGIAKLQLQQGLTRAVRSRQGSKDSGINKSSENSTSFLDSDCSLERRAVRRPTTLRLRGLASDEDLGSDGDRGSSDIQTTEVKLRKPKKRIKTPRRPVGPRFSLYDDSVMSGDVPPGLVKEESLSRSLPQDMDALGNTRRKSFPSRGSSSSGKTGSLSLRQSERSTGGSSVEGGGSGIYDMIKPPEVVVMIPGAPIRAEE